MSIDVTFYEKKFPYKGVVKGSVSDNFVIPQMINEDPCSFKVNDEELLHSQDYNRDNFDLINKNEEFYDPWQNGHNENINHTENLRTSTRHRKNPTWHKDYVMHCTKDTSKKFTSPHYPPTFPYFHFAMLTQTHRNLFSLIS